MANFNMRKFPLQCFSHFEVHYSHFEVEIEPLVETQQRINCKFARCRLKLDTKSKSLSKLSQVKTRKQ